MIPPHRCLPALLTLLLAGCQALQPAAPDDAGGQNQDFGSGLVALYASPSEARAVALGQFGAVPVLLAREDELQPASGCPGARAEPQGCRCMRKLGTGQLGWRPSRPPNRRRPTCCRRA